MLKLAIVRVNEDSGDVDRVLWYADAEDAILTRLEELASKRAWRKGSQREAAQQLVRDAFNDLISDAQQASISLN